MRENGPGYCFALHAHNVQGIFKLTLMRVRKNFLMEGMEGAGLIYSHLDIFHFSQM